MIFNKSVLDGFAVVLGSMPIQFGMLMTLLLSIQVPKNMDSGKYQEEAQFVYYLLIFTHSAILTVKFLRQYLAYTHYMLYRSLMMLSLFLQMFSMNFVLGRWVYDQSDTEVLNAQRGENWESDYHWQTFEMWMRVEQFMFMGPVASGVFFMFVRSFYKCQVQISEQTDTALETTDHLESNHIVLELNDSNLTPLFASVMLLNDQKYSPNQDIEWCVNLFFIG